MLRPLRKILRREWKEKLERQASSGLSIRRWCKDQEITYNTFLYWKKKLGSKKSVALTDFKELMDPPLPQEITIEFFGARLLLPRNFDPEILSQFLRVLKSC